MSDNYIVKESGRKDKGFSNKKDAMKYAKGRSIQNPTKNIRIDPTPKESRFKDGKKIK